MLWLADWLAVDGHYLSRADRNAEHCRLAVDGHSALFDNCVGLSAAHAGCMGDIFVEALRISHVVSIAQTLGY